MYLIDKLYYLQIGVQGENVARQIEVDMTSWVEQFPSAAFHVLFMPYNAQSVSPQVSTYQDGILTWIPTLGATAVAGVGYTEIRAVDPDTRLIRKTRIIPTSVENSVTGVDAEDPPEPYEDWVNSVLAARDDAFDYMHGSEAWAVGERAGQVVPQSDETWHNNAKWYKDLAEQATSDKGYMFVYIDEETGHLIYNATVDVNIDLVMDEGRLKATWPV